MEPLEKSFFEKTARFSAKEQELIRRSFIFAENAHAGQKRFSGEPYFNHIIRVAENLVDFGGDAETVSAGLLHDTVEDCGVSSETIKKEFGENIALLVSGTSKFGKLKYQGRERYAENMRHLFISIADDIRVLLIKLADRLDNIRTLAHVPAHKQKRIALETLEIYAPVANRLGMGRLKIELEDEAFKWAYPKEYQETETLIRERGKERKKYIEKVFKSLSKQLAKRGFRDAKVSYRIKDMWSIHKKLLKKDMEVTHVYDMYALRVLVPTVEDCYRVLGIIHGLWKPLPGRIKDYIANPKINGYQSLHTTVFTGDGGIAEIQVRTPEMHRNAEYGIAAHLLYKNEHLSKTEREKLSWLSKIKELHEHSTESEEFLKNLKVDLFEKRIFVFTPKGDVIELPESATALDFAYSIHSEIGNHAGGAKTNGKLVSLDTKLENGDIVEIFTKKGNHPTRKWIPYARTSLAKRHIRQWLQKNEGRTLD